MCHQNDTDDEYHYIFKCPFYEELREKYIKRFYYVKPNVYKLVKLLSVDNTKELNNLGKFLLQTVKL